MADLPTGTVTFLFTDIEGSTRLWEQQPQAMRVALACHETLIRQAVDTHGGVVFKIVGDGVCAAFATAADTCAAAVAAQRALCAYAWGETGPLLIRMALHTGIAEAHTGDYFGLPLSRVARLLEAGHGGQVLLSSVTHELVRDQLPPDVALRDLGEHRLKDLTRPEQIFQLVAPDLPADFPPLRTLDAHPTNLPAQPTALVGREREVAAACARMQLPEVRLLSLTGPGGTGKTRLGLQVAADLLDHFSDGVYVVTLAPISDPNLVLPTVATTLGVKEVGGQPLVDTLASYLRDKRLLLVLDNFEQVLSAAPLVAALLAAAPALKVLITSRAVLHLSGEHEYAVLPLALPDLARLPPVESLAALSAIALFVQRAQAARPDFQLTEANAAAVAEICYRLDGLPLSIELAAARTKVLPPPALLARLTSRLQLLTGGPRDLPKRQQTLRGTIEWSYHLLDVGEQTLFRRLAIFMGGCTLEAAAAVCTLDDWRLELGDAPPQPSITPFDLLDQLAALIDKSLLRREEDADGEPRFVMLETIREYALEQLLASGEAAIARQLHAYFFLALAEEAEPRLITGEQRAWLARLQLEHDNLRAALAWSLEAGNPAIGLRLAGALCWFWYIGGHCAEGRRWLREALVISGDTAPAVLAKAYSTAGTLAFAQTDLDRATAHHDQALTLFQHLGDAHGVALTLNNLGLQAAWMGDLDHAARLYAQSLDGARAVGDRWLIAGIVTNLGLLARERGDSAQAVTYYQQSLVLYREQGDQNLIATVLSNLGEVLVEQADYMPATTILEESLALSRQQNNRLVSGYALQMLAKIATAQGDRVRAEALFDESLRLFQEVGFARGVAEGLEGLAVLACAAGAYRRATYLCGAAEAVRESRHAPMPPADHPAYDQTIATLRTRLDAAAFAAAWAEGRTMTPSQALAVSEPASEPREVGVTTHPPAALPAYPAGLTEREVDVLRLLARGLSYAQIAEQLVISPRTVNRHLTSIYTKLDVTSRHAAMRFAVEHHLT